MGDRFDKNYILKQIRKHTNERREVYLRFEFYDFYPLEVVFLPYSSYLKIINFFEDPLDLVVVVTPYICLCSTLSRIGDRVVVAYEHPDERVLRYDLDLIHLSVESFFSLSKKLRTSLRTTYS